MRKLIVLLLCLSLVGCGFSSGVAQLESYGKDHQIRMYNGGTLVAEWTSKGKVTSLVDSDGWQFMDKATGKLVRVGGDVIIEVVK